jgi:two-component system sensor histidine kinase TctE
VPEPRRRVEQRSLFGEILDWMLAPLLLLWPMSLGLTWLVAQGIANRPYDRELSEAVLALARQASVQVIDAEGPGKPDLRAGLERMALALLGREEDGDLAFFQVLGARGQLVAGDARLALPGDGDPLSTPASRLATEIIKGVLLPQFVILPVAVLLVWLALARGIRPLADVQQRIRRRDSTDLSPIETGGVPDEVAPLVDSINDLLQRLDQTIAAQRQFLADAAHQLKTPLAGLRMQAELAARDIAAGRGDAATLTHSLTQIAVSTQRAAHMVDQLLAMARADAAAGQVLQHRPVNLAALVRPVVRDFVAKAMDRRIDLGYEGPDDDAPPAGLTLLGEPVLLGELVRNLVDNALQYTPAGGTVTARVVPDPFGQVVVLQVEDTGPGIPPAERDAVFRPFYRALGTQVDGSGLGLAIVLEIAQRHGATVALADARPRHAGPGATPPGALFPVRFPLAPAPPASVSSA